ncbi:MAG: TetR/AcrR family transcriptional regulator [Actinomycetota bacterium]|nr:TetR/AcrR family transcriptional regulator [Actinomycetota bacterium]
MPKVTEAYREGRRDEIAQAAMRCLTRKGFANTSMADIIAESDASAGAIYSHFASKAEIARHVARMVMDSKAGELTAFAEGQGRPVPPAELILFLLQTLGREGVSKPMLLQLWAEATVDPEIHRVMGEAVGQLRRAYAATVRPWLIAHEMAGDEASVQRAAATMLTLSQGFIANTALLGDRDPAEYLATAGMLLR